MEMSLKARHDVLLWERPQYIVFEAFLMRISYMLKPIIALLITIFLWASAFVGIRYGLSVYTPGAIALFRFILASLFLTIHG